jgi:hypothetical protein
MSGILHLGRQLHADIYRALRCVEENELDLVPPERLMKVASLASELVGALGDLWAAPDEEIGPETDRASEAHTARSEGHWRAE